MEIDKKLLNEEFHDACGIGFIAELNAKPGRRVIELSIEALKNMSHRGASGSDEKMRIAPAVKFTLEEALEYIQSDEYVEVTPKSIRLRKIFLNENDRKRERNKALAN